MKSSKKKIARKIRPDCSAVGPNLGDYSPRVRQRAPAKREELTPAFRQVSSPLVQLLNIAVEGSDAEVVVLLQQEFLDEDKYRNSPEGVPSRLLSSRPETRGLHPVGALARPHREEQEKQRPKGKTYPDGCPRRQVRLGAILESVALGTKLRLDVQKRLVQRPCAASSHPPNGRGARRFGVWDRRAGGAGLQGAWRRSRLLKTVAHWRADLKE